MNEKNIGEAWCEGNHFRIEAWIDKETGSWHVLVKDTNGMEPKTVLEEHGGRGIPGSRPIVVIAPEWRGTATGTDGATP